MNARPLTPKQDFVVELFRARGPMTAFRLGTLLHATWADPPKHDEDDPCKWCEGEGNNVLQSVGLKPYVIQRRNPSRWELRAGHETDVQDRGEIPF